MVFSLGLAFLALAPEAQKPTGEKSRLLFLIAAGAMAALGFFAKFPTSVANLMVLTFLVAMVRGPGKRWSGAGLVILGYLLGFVFYFAFIIDAATWWSQFSYWFQVNVFGTGVEATYKPGTVFEVYFKYLALQGRQALWCLASYGLAYGLGLLAKREDASARHGAALFVLSLALVLIGYRISTHCALWVGGTPESVFAQLWLFGILLFYTLGFSPPGTPGGWRAGLTTLPGLGFIILLAAPIMAVLGSYNVGTIQLLQHLIPWFGLSLVLMDRLKSRSRTGLLPNFIIMALTVIIPFQVWTSFIMRPFRMQESRLEQTERVQTRVTDRLNGVYVSPAKKELIEGIDQILAEKTDFRPGDPLLTESNNPGLVWLFKGREPGNPLLGPRIWWRLALAKKGLEHPERAVLLFIKRNHDEIGGIPTDVVQTLRQVGVDYPDKYMLAGSVKRWRIYSPKRNGD